MKKQCECCLSSNNLKDLSENYIDLIALCFSIKVPTTRSFGASPNFICSSCVVNIIESSAFRSQILTSQTALKEYFSSNTSNNESNELESNSEGFVKEEFLSDCDDDDSYNCPIENSDIHNLNVQIHVKDESTEKTFEHKPFEEKILKVEPNRLEKPNSEQIEQVLVPKSDNPSIEKDVASTKDNSGCQIIKKDKSNENLFEYEVPIEKTITYDDHIVHNSEDSKNDSIAQENLTVFTVSEIESNLNEECASIAESNKKNVTKSRVNYDKFNRTPFKIDKTARTCELCNETFNAYKPLVIHMAVHYPNFICDICGRPFTRKKSYTRHIQGHQPMSPCTICNKLVKPLYLINHMKTHSDNYTKQTVIKKCLICDKVYSSNNELKRHTERIHLKISRYTCHLCDRGFYRKGELNMHLEIHSGEKNYECHFCLKRFGVLKLLNTHIKKWHMENTSNVCENIFECDTCKKQFERKSSLIEHMGLH